MKIFFFINLLIASFSIRSLAEELPDEMALKLSDSWTTIRPKGSFDFRYDLFALPTSRRGHTAFDLTEMRLGFVAESSFFQKLNLLYDLQESRPTEASVSLVRNDERTEDSIEGGIVIRPWFQQISLTSASRFYGGIEFYPLARRYKYDSESDKGLVLSRQWKLEDFTVSLAATNGEGSNRVETGSSKDFELLILQKSQIWQWMLAYVWGAYDEYTGAEMRKERIKGFLQYQSSSDTAFAEILYSVDPQTAIAERKIAEGVDLTSQPGERIFGLSTRLFFRHDWSDLWGTVFQFDSLQPDVTNRKKDFWEATFGMTYRWNPRTRLWAGGTHASFFEEHSASIRDQQRFSFAMRLVF